MYLGQTAEPATAPDLPWYARPGEAILDWVGDVTYVTDDYTIRSEGGALVIDRSSAPAPGSVSPAGLPAQSDLFGALARIPPIVWAGVGGIVLFSMMRR